jgi:hypothetical protein
MSLSFMYLIDQILNSLFYSLGIQLSWGMQSVEVGGLRECGDL